MDVRTASSLLGVPLGADKAMVKRAYYKKALMTHPDKSSDPDAAEKFRKLKEAYSFLSSEPENATDEFVFQRFFSDTFVEQFLEKLDDDSVWTIFEFVLQYRDFFSEESRMFSLLQRRLAKPHVVIEASLDAMFAQKVFIYTHENGKKYTIPLWHHTLQFEDLIVSLKLVTGGADVWIDDCNDVHVVETAKLSNVFRAEALHAVVGGKQHVVKASDLRCVPFQTHTVVGGGIPRLNVDNLLDASRLGDVVFHVHFSSE
jgi:hypothetical protein